MPPYSKIFAGKTVVQSIRPSLNSLLLSTNSKQLGQTILAVHSHLIIVEEL